MFRLFSPLQRRPLIDTVIFDVDGTLAETEEVHRRAFNQAFAEFGLGWVWDEALYRDLLRVTGGKERIAHFCARVGGRSLDPALIAELHHRKTALYAGMVEAGEVALRPGVPAFLDAAQSRGLGLAIATTTTPANVEALLRSALGANWREIFPVVAAGDMVERKKPAPDVYFLALERLGRDADRCIAVEDSRNGVLAAKSAGLRVIGVRSAYNNDDLSGASFQLPDCLGLSLALLRQLDQTLAN
jgi:HAD superfamily hydrolase (TIGR01509 family)